MLGVMRYHDQVLLDELISLVVPFESFLLYSRKRLFISLIDVKVMEVVEKRSWESIFPMEGSGRVHLKLRFILNAEEHNRISEMV